MALVQFQKIVWPVLISRAHKLLTAFAVALIALLNATAAAGCDDFWAKVVLHIDALGYPVQVTVLSRKRILYRFPCTSPPVLVVPRQKLVLVGAIFKVIARDRSGKRIWTSAVASSPNAPDSMVAGGRYVIVNCYPGIVGWATLRSIEEWPRVYFHHEFVVLALKDGKRIKSGNWRDFGRPIWTNGKVFITEHMDLSSTTVRQVATHKQRLPVWLEVRSLKTFRLLWRKRLPGFLPNLDRVRKGRVQGTVELSFRGRHETSVETTGTHRLSFYQPVVPLFGSVLESCPSYSIE